MVVLLLSPSLTSASCSFVVAPVSSTGRDAQTHHREQFYPKGLKVTRASYAETQPDAELHFPYFMGAADGRVQVSWPGI